MAPAKHPLKRPTQGNLIELGGVALGCALVLGCTADMQGADGAGPPGASTGGIAGAGAGTSMGGTGATAGSNTPQGGGGGTAGSAGAAPTGGSGPVVPDPPPYEAAPGMLRRLTRAQFHNAVRDVFGVEVDVSELDADSWDGNFAVIGASRVSTSETGVEHYHAAIESAVDAVFGDTAKRSAFIGCTPTGRAEDACLRGFIETKGRRAWRRPLEAEEVDRLATVAATAATELGSATEGARWAAVALFTSPHFLYRPELGAPAANGSLRFTGYELASRLAFLAWNSLPDDALLDEAGSGALGTADGIRNAAQTLLGAPAGREAVGAFAEEYMRLDRLLTQAKDGGLFPEYTPSLQAAMVRDMRETWASIAFDDQASALELFTTRKVVVNADLARLYGLPTTGLDQSTFGVLTLPADDPRAGILSKAGFLSQFANQKEGSPTLRGKFMREALMCQTIEPPPGNVNTVLPDLPDMPMTKRQRLEMHRTADACSGCHSLMDPLGLPLENFDAIGKYRTTDHGLPIDPSGDFDDAPVTDAKDLGVVVSQSPLVTQCLVRKYYAYAMGYPERPVDGSVVNAVATSFQASGFKLRDLVLAVVTHDAFSSVAPQTN